MYVHFFIYNLQNLLNNFDVGNHQSHKHLWARVYCELYVCFVLSTSYGLNNPSVFLSISKFSVFLG